MRPKGTARSMAWALGGGAILCSALVSAGFRWPELFSVAGASADFTLGGKPDAGHAMHPLLELAKLVSAAAMGLVVTGVHRYRRRDKPLSRALEQAQILLCVCGALMMIIIGNSFARALGVAGGASIIRFRTPVKDPMDSTILFLLLGLGMACGLGAFAVAGLGTAFICVVLLVLDHVGELKSRAMNLEVTAADLTSSAERVEEVLTQSGLDFESRGCSQGDDAVLKYHVSVKPTVALGGLTAGIMGAGSAGIKSVKWEKAKKKSE